jgi:hypothetical protein
MMPRESSRGCKLNIREFWKTSTPAPENIAVNTAEAYMWFRSLFAHMSINVHCQRGIGVRERLPNRRAAETWDIQVGGLRYTISVGYYESGRIGEIFIQNHKQGSQAGLMAADSAVLCSIALQHGVPIETLRHALMRDGRGKPSGPLGVVLDQLAQEER